MKKLVTLMFALAALTMGAMAVAEDAEKPETSIKEVMKVCMKGGLCKKVASGDASAEEKAKLLKMFTAMCECKPKKGDADSWKEKTAALVKAAQAAVDNKDGAGDALKAAANCAACHKAHK